MALRTFAYRLAVWPIFAYLGLKRHWKLTLAIHGHFGRPEHCIFRLGQGVLSYMYVFMNDFLPLMQMGTTVVISRLVPWTTKSSKRGLNEHLRKVRGARSSLCLTYFRYKVDFILLFCEYGWMDLRTMGG